MPLEFPTIHCFCLVVLFVFLFPLASSTPLSPLTLPLTLISNSSINQPNPIRTHCVADSSWTTPKYESRNDCEDAVNRLYLTDYGRFSARRFQFLAAHATVPGRPQDTVRTPRRYTIASCTIAIVMLTDFPSSQPFPGKPPGPYPSRAATSYEKVWQAAVRIIRGCVMLEGFAGWEVVGKDEGIGVFVWSKGSETDIAVGGGS